jgi:hypothetical protein
MNGYEVRGDVLFNRRTGHTDEGCEDGCATQNPTGSRDAFIGVYIDPERRC